MKGCALVARIWERETYLVDGVRRKAARYFNYAIISELVDDLEIVTIFHYRTLVLSIVLKDGLFQYIQSFLITSVSDKKAVKFFLNYFEVEYKSVNFSKNQGIGWIWFPDEKLSQVESFVPYIRE